MGQEDDEHNDSESSRGGQERGEGWLIRHPSSIGEGERSGGSKLVVDGHDLTASVHVVHDLLLKPAHVLLELVDDAAQLGVLALEQLDLVLEPGDAFELAPSALGGGHAVPLPLPLQFDLLLVLHVDRRHRWRARHARHSLRLVLDVHQAGIAHGGLCTLHTTGRLQSRVRRAVHAAGFLRAVGVMKLVERVDEAARVQLLSLGDRFGEEDLGGRCG